jgi:hypothetical protein
MRFTQVIAVLSLFAIGKAAPVVDVEVRTTTDVTTQCQQSTSLHCCTSSSGSASQGGLFGSLFGGGLSITCGKSFSASLDEVVY